ncbi:zinc finger BED domain-containing protein 5-like [Limulus polyphemus]|uniref:Zinc finger BED domain-containing protein 5-like n=1 Tax=Limulus polyphemus TaxID=6850 RepID=A0ABM1BUD9_LIMPO|nr:zinc finger BED domain-containing protein 5-like [Limulus polyphemus]
MDKFLKKKRDIDECNPESEQTSNVESCSSKKAKPRPTRKYNESYLRFGFSWTGNVDNPQPVCLVCGIKMSNESMLPSKLGKDFKSKHSHLQDKPTSYFKRMSGQQGKAADSFKKFNDCF